MSLASIESEMNNGALAGAIDIISQKTLTPKEMADSLHEYGSEPSLFELDDNGLKAEDCVQCIFCEKQVEARTAHLHRGKYVGDCCWDERLRTSE
jgi:hypothetical protein